MAKCLVVVLLLSLAVLTTATVYEPGKYSVGSIRFLLFIQIPT